LSGTLALNRALIGRWSALPLLAAPLLYNSILLIGVVNYIFGIGLVLWALAAWVALRDRPWLWRMTVSAAFVIALFFCHLVSVALYGLGLFAFEVERLWRSRDFRKSARIFEFCSAGIPFIPVVPLLLASPTWGLATDYSWEQSGKIDGLLYVFGLYWDFVTFTLIGAAAAGLVWAVRHKLVRFSLMGWILLALGSVIYLATPRVLFAVDMADQRLPVGLVFMLIACIDFRFPRRAIRYSFVTVLVALVCLRVGEAQIMWDKLSKGVESVHDSVKYIDRGSQVLVAYADSDGGDDVRDLGLMHAACLAMIERSALVTTAFAVRGKQILRVRADYADHADTEDGTPPTVEKLVLSENGTEPVEAAYWSGWLNHYDYIYVLFTRKGAENPDPVHLRLVYEGRRFQLYRMASPHTTTTASASAERLKKKPVLPTRVD
jgi:hypothetical protein